MTTFRITGLPVQSFSHLFGLDDAALAAHGAQRHLVDEKPGFPDRIELRDLKPGEHALLVNYLHQPAEGPYRSSHAVFVRDGGGRTYDRVDEVPEALRIRPLSLRGFDERGMMLAADLVDGARVEALIREMFAIPGVAYIQAHYAKRGCYAARIERA